jgi:ribonuclease T2
LKSLLKDLKITAQTAMACTLAHLWIRRTAKPGMQTKATSKRMTLVPDGSLVGIVRYLVLLVTLAAGQAHAQRGGEPGRFDYYVLVLGWTPSYCAMEGKQRRDRQCAAERPHAFTLHGLWPQNVKGWPEDCRTRKRAWVSQSVIDDLRDVMPSKNLIIHEYRTHGTCSGLEPAQYFGLARDLYQRVSIPPRFSGVERGLDLTEAEIEAEFLKSNAWLKPNMIVVSCRRQNLLDVRICFGRDLFPKPCGSNEERRVCRAGRINVPAARQH